MKKWLLIGLVILAVGAFLLYQDPGFRAYLDRESDKILPESVTHTTVYKWKDRSGQWQISNDPPPIGTRYETIQYRKDTNVIPAEKLTGKKQD